MNPVQRDEWLEATQACLRLKSKLFLKLLKRMDGLSLGRWEAAFSAGAEQDSVLRLRFFGAEHLRPEQLFGIASIFGADAPPIMGRRPTAGLASVSIDWNGRDDRILSLGFYGRKPAGNQGWLWHSGQAPQFFRYQEVAFSKEAFPLKALKKSFLEFASLCLISSIRLEWQSDGPAWRPRGQWAMLLKERVFWPLVLRTDLAAGLASNASQLSLLTSDRKVSELLFEGERLRLYFGA